jgi:hypothetical protein
VTAVLSETRTAVTGFLAWLEEDAVAGADDLGRAAASLAEADAFGDPDRLAVRVRVPGGARAPRVKWTLLELTREPCDGAAISSM